MIKWNKVRPFDISDLEYCRPIIWIVAKIEDNLQLPKWILTYFTGAKVPVDFHTVGTQLD